MTHRVAPEAQADLDNIWYYVAKESGNTEIADRLIDSLAARFYVLACHPHIDGAAMKICVLACAVFPWASTSSFTALQGRTC